MIALTKYVHRTDHPRLPKIFQPLLYPRQWIQYSPSSESKHYGRYPNSYRWYEYQQSSHCLLCTHCIYAIHPRYKFTEIVGIRKRFVWAWLAQKLKTSARPYRCNASLTSHRGSHPSSTLHSNSRSLGTRPRIILQ